MQANTTITLKAALAKWIFCYLNRLNVNLRYVRKLLATYRPISPNEELYSKTLKRSKTQLKVVSNEKQEG
jgi:hypothetical protein